MLSLNTSSIEHLESKCFRDLMFRFKKFLFDWNRFGLGGSSSSYFTMSESS